MHQKAKTMMQHAIVARQDRATKDLTLLAIGELYIHTFIDSPETATVFPRWEAVGLVNLLNRNAISHSYGIVPIIPEGL